MAVYIKHIAKDVLLYELWRAARNSPNFYYCKDLQPTLTPEVTKSDINHMINNERKIDVTTYYGRMLYIDITDDYADVLTYESYNGQGSAEKIINKLKIQELQKSICRYFTFF